MVWGNVTVSTWISLNFHYSLFYSISAGILHLIKVAWSPRLRSKLHMGTDNSENHQYFDVNHRHFHVHHQHFHVNQLPQTSKITRRTCERALQDGQQASPTFRLFLGGGINPAVQPVDWSLPPRPTGALVEGERCEQDPHTRGLGKEPLSRAPSAPSRPPRLRAASRRWAAPG